MADRYKRRLNRRFDRFETELPGRAARTLRAIRDPGARWIRIPLALLLIVGGTFGFLPVLGLWMLPLGFLLLALDIRILRAPTGAALVRLERWWARWKRRRRTG